LTLKKKNYIDYIANRPRVERIGGHGLFTDAGRPGYDRGEQWMALLRSKRAMLCREMKIDSASLRWYAALLKIL
jgi:hypothetical protein